MPNFSGASRAPRARRDATAAGVVVLATATALLLTACDPLATAEDIGEEFGNARQVEETATGAATAAAPGTTPGAGGSASPSPSPSPEVLPSFDAATVVGDYAPGFPSGLLPMPEGAQLLATSAEPVKGSKPATVQVTLNLSSKKAPGTVMEQVAGLLGKKGFEALDAPAESGMSEQAAFTRTTTVKGAEVAESLLVGVLKDGKRSLLTLSGTVAAVKAS
ncbi:hypothetical protein [Myceligenerans crystallogenes]|uniref:hypothetical protein n=1 Tax=Myceligenerans crystallogenes TaxID=316335 RepID=UPI0031DEA2FD